MKRYIDKIASLPLFMSFTANEIPSILVSINSKIVSYKKSDTVGLMEESSSRVGVVLKGELKIADIDINGNVILVNKIPEGGIFGEAFIFSSHNKIPMHITAELPSDILFIDYKKIITASPNSSPFNARLIENMMRLMTQKLIYLRKTLSIVQKSSIRDKIVAYLEMVAKDAKSHTFDLPLSKNELAEYLGVNRSALSRELGNMKNDGIIEFDKNRFTIHLGAR